MAKCNIIDCENERAGGAFCKIHTKDRYRNTTRCIAGGYDSSHPLALIDRTERNEAAESIAAQLGVSHYTMVHGDRM